MLDDDTLPRKIIACLGRQPEVPIRVASQLSQARAHALSRLAVPRPLWARLVQWPPLRAGAGIAFVLVVVAYATWQLYTPQADLADLDAELLTGALPPAAYVDPGFARFVSGNGG